MKMKNGFLKYLLWFHQQKALKNQLESKLYKIHNKKMFKKKKVLFKRYLKVIKINLKMKY